MAYYAYTLAMETERDIILSVEYLLFWQIMRINFRT